MLGYLRRITYFRGMETNEIKKAIYKEKPIANRIKGDDGYMYTAKTSLGIANFFIPFKEMGTTPFDREMPSQLLLRWLI